MNRSDERGIATVLGVTTVGLMLVFAVVLVQVALVVATKHRVQAAADLAALAGSSSSLRGRDACKAAWAVARENGASLRRCRTNRAVITVQTEGQTTLLWGIGVHEIADARAAPDFYVSSTRSRGESAGRRRD